MTDSLREKIEAVLQNEEVTQKILHDPQYGRRSLAKDFDYSKYYCQKVIDEIKENPKVDVQNKKVITEGSDNSQETQIEDTKERATDPIDASDWDVPEDWVYDKNYIYNNDDDKYVFMTREFGNIVRSGSWVKQLVRAYSDWDGDPDTINEVCRKFGITRGLFQAIKQILGLTHDHEPFTPDEIRDKDPEQMAQEAYQMKRFKTKQAFDKIDWKETQKEAKKWRNLKQSILDEVKAEAPEIVINPIEPSGNKREVDDVVLYTTDWHLGAYAMGLKYLPDFDSTILKDYIDQMVKTIRADFPTARVHVKFLGDAIETVTGMNHADSWKNIEKGYYGAKPILEAEKYFLHLLKSIEASSFQAVTGNHGRITSERRKDHSGEAELIIYDHLKQRIKGMDVEYTEHSFMDVVEGIGHIGYHGHLKFSKDVEQNVLDAFREDFDSNVDYVIVAQGHYHEPNILTSNTLFRHITVPSLFTGHDYNKRNGYGNLAGFCAVFRHPVTGKVKTDFYSL